MLHHHAHRPQQPQAQNQWPKPELPSRHARTQRSSTKPQLPTTQLGSGPDRYLVFEVLAQPGADFVGVLVTVDRDDLLESGNDDLVLLTGDGEGVHPG